MIIRVTSPILLTTQPIIDLFQKGYEGASLGKADNALKSLLMLVEKPTTGLFLGLENAELKAFSIVFIPDLPLYGLPQVHHFYNEGSPALRNELLTHMVGFVKEYGYNKWLAINQAGPVEAYARLWRRFGKIREVGSVMEVEYGNDGQLDGEREQRQGQWGQHPDADRNDAPGVPSAAIPDSVSANELLQSRRADLRRAGLGGGSAVERSADHDAGDLHGTVDGHRGLDPQRDPKRVREQRRGDPRSHVELSDQRSEPELSDQRAAKSRAGHGHKGRNRPARKRVSKRHDAKPARPVRRKRAGS